jgi:hypothetical protein
MQIKRQLINAIFIPTLCYQCQTWTLTKELERKLSSCEMRVLRKAANKTMRDRMQNEEIRKIVGTTPVNEYIEKQRVNWFGHLMRMNPNWPASKAYNMKLETTRGRGRPRKRWIDGVNDTLKLHNITACQATERALTRKKIIKSNCYA